MYSAFRCERPAVRNVAMSFSTTWAGVGKCLDPSPVLGGRVKRELNLFFIDEAAAPETCVPICQSCSSSSAESWRGFTCCAMIPLLNAVNGSTTSCKPSGLNILQTCLSITACSFGSTLTRCAHAFSSRFSVVVPGSAALCDEGKADSKRSDGYLTTFVPSGVCKGAFVLFGAAFRIPPAGLRLGFVLVWERAAIAEGVGVKGGSSEAVSGSFFRLLGV